MASPHVHQDVFALTECLSHAPHWEAVVLGPVPFGKSPSERVSLAVNAIIVPTREEAEEVVWTWVRQACSMYDHAFNEDEWDIVHLGAFNLN